MTSPVHTSPRGDSGTPAQVMTLHGIRVTVSPQGGYLAKTPACQVAANESLDPNLALDPPADAMQRMERGQGFELDVEQLLRTELETAGIRIVTVHDIAASDVTTQALHDAAVFITEVRDENGERTIEAKAVKERDTMLALEAGALLVWNARFPADFAGMRNGEPDLLIRVGDTLNAAGKYAYHPADVKHHKEVAHGATKPRTYPVSSLASPQLHQAADRELPGKTQLVDSKQLAHYYRILQAFGHADDADQIWGAVIGTGLELVWRDLTDSSERALDRKLGKIRTTMSALELYDQEFAHRIAVIIREKERRTKPELEPLATPAWSSDCDACVWRKACRGTLEEQQHVTLVLGITPARAEALTKNGISSYPQLAKLDHRTAELVDLTAAETPVLIEAARDLPEPGLHEIVDHLIDVQDLTRERKLGEKVRERKLGVKVQQLAAAGFTPDELAGLDDTTAKLAGSKPYRLADSIDAARARIEGKVFRRRGVDVPSLPAADIEVDFDLENARDGRVYLIGERISGLSYGRGNRPVFHSHVSWELTEQAETNVFLQFWESVQWLLRFSAQTGATLRWYHYHRHERITLRRLVAAHQDVPGMPTVEEFDGWLDAAVIDGKIVFGAAADGELPDGAQRLVVDLCQELEENLVWPTDSHSIKDTAPHTGFAWPEKGANGGQSLDWYDLATDPNATPEQRELMRQRLIAYNEADCDAQPCLRGYFIRRGSSAQPGIRVPSIASLDTKYGPGVPVRRLTAA